MFTALIIAHLNKAGYPNTCCKSDKIKAMHAVLMLLRPLPSVGIKNSSMWGIYNLAKAYRSIKNPLPIVESRTGKPAMVTLKIQLDCSTVHDMKLWANIFVRSHLGCGTDSVFICFCRSHKYFKDAKVMQINRILKIVKFDMPSSITPKTIVILTKVFCTSGPNLVILVWRGDELSHRQAQNLTMKVKVNHPQNNRDRDLNQGLLHIWSKYGDPSFEQVMSYCTDKLVITAHTESQTDIRKQRQYPKAKTGLG